MIPDFNKTPDEVILLLSPLECLALSLQAAPVIRNIATPHYIVVQYPNLKVVCLSAYLCIVLNQCPELSRIRFVSYTNLVPVG